MPPTPALQGQVEVVVKRARNLKPGGVAPTPETPCDPFVALTVGDTTVRTSVVDDEANPSFEESFRFQNVQKDDKMEIQVFNKCADGMEDQLIGTAMVAHGDWGLPDYPKLAWHPILTDLNTCGGEIQLSIEWDLQLNFKQPFKAISDASSMTGSLVSVIDEPLDRVLAKVSNCITTPLRFLQQRSPMEQAAIGAVVVCVGGGAGLCVAVPLIFFLPVTLFFAFGIGTALLVASPLLLLFGWLLISAIPMQRRLVVPLLIQVVPWLGPVEKYVLTPPATTERAARKPPPHVDSLGLD